MGRHSVARHRRITPSVVSAAALFAPYVLLLAAGGDVSVPAPASEAAAAPDQSVDDVASRSVEIVASAPNDFAAAPASTETAVSAAPAQFASASRYRVYDREA